MTTPEAPFRTAHIALDAGGKSALTLQPVTAADAPPLAASMAAIDPWLTLGISAERLGRALLDPDPHVCVRALQSEDARPAGVVSVRYPWLFGPYLALLAVFPEHQGDGLGSAVLAWLEREASAAGHNNVWVCASTFNQRAIGFYRRHGFEPVGELPGLVVEGLSELLLRKRLPLCQSTVGGA